MWVAINGLLINLNNYSHFTVKQIFGKHAVVGLEVVNGEQYLLTFENEEQAKDTINELALKIAGLKDCGCHAS